MNSFMYFIGYFFASLIMNVSCSLSGGGSVDNHRDFIIGYPYYFGYKPKATLNIEIHLRNIPTSVTWYVILCQGNAIKKKKLIDQYIKNENIPVFQVIEYTKIWIEVQLWTRKSLCTGKQIVEGRKITKSTADQRFKYDDRCLQTSRYCVIIVDLKDECKAHPATLSTFDCHRESSKFICVTHTGTQDHVSHQWYQGYIYELLIGNIPPTPAKSSKFSLDLETFDNNTILFNNLTSTTTRKVLSSYKGLITFYANESIDEDNNVITLKYSDAKDVYFNCTKYLKRTNFTQVGLINTTSNKIETLNTADVNKNFTKADSGNILCCVYYIIFNGDGDAETHIHRLVTDKTLLLYEYTGYNKIGEKIIPPQHNNGYKSKDDQTMSTDLKNTTIYVTSTVAYPGKSKEDSQGSIIIIIVSAVVIFLLLLIIIAVKKRCWIKTERPQLPIPFEPFYLNLLFRRECEREIDANEQNQYEDINEKEQNQYEDINENQQNQYEEIR